MTVTAYRSAIDGRSSSSPIIAEWMPGQLCSTGPTQPAVLTGLEYQPTSSPAGFLGRVGTRPGLHARWGAGHWGDRPGVFR